MGNDFKALWCFGWHRGNPCAIEHADARGTFRRVLRTPLWWRTA